MEHKGNRVRRILAFFTDLILLCFSTFIMAIALLSLLGNFAIYIVFVLGIACLVIFFLRDYLFRGRSIGKRLFKLRVVDADTRSEPTAKQLVVKSFFLFLYLFDGLTMIFSGKSLAERATRTVVVREFRLSREDPRPDYEERTSQKQKTITKKRVAVVVVAVMCICVPMLLLLNVSLEGAKKQENYRIAYTYLISSEAYIQMQTEESQIALTGYSSGVRSDGEGNVSAADTFSFMVRGQQYQVVCHQDGDAWYVCDDCTEFE